MITLTPNWQDVKGEVNTGWEYDLPRGDKGEDESQLPTA